MIDEVHVGQLMREIRKNKGFTSTKMAEKLHISQPKLSRIETGNQPVSISLLSRFCIICQMSLVDFFRLLEERTNFHQLIHESRATYQEISTMDRIFANLTKEEKEAIHYLIYTFKSER
ncbi:helix-turn-helix domain-containing protein [Fervidibacillus halotolerans]|uniref:Helix-turn-helix domain-containing protein n=1 Tax=Fervidibacillus halotolerans TaxID=2980027 RepID=A0A9E8RZ26_9BACI|nr:helix-turn-helix transcriptional regulator [Fervidibacillus halotolerans]WAA13456.1 helix-turn-helix domain-containing protein [Fervidibacillus halotolerans]